MKEYGRQNPYTFLKCVAFCSTPYISCRIHYLRRTIMHTGICTHMLRAYSAGSKLIQGPRRVFKSSKITTELALNCAKALGGNIADKSFPRHRDRPHIFGIDLFEFGISIVLQYNVQLGKIQMA